MPSIGVRAYAVAITSHVTTISHGLFGSVVCRAVDVHVNVGALLTGEAALMYFRVRNGAETPAGMLQFPIHWLG